MNLKGQVSKLMKTKIAGIPAPILAGGVAVVAIYVIRKRQAAAAAGGTSSTASTPADTSAGATDPGISGAASSGGGYDAGMTGGGGAAGGADYYTPSYAAGPADGTGIIAATPAGPTTETVRRNIRNVRNVNKLVYIGRVRKTKIVHPRRGAGPIKVGGGHTPPIIRRRQAHHVPAGGVRVNMRTGNRRR
ncbi:MAG: hypothetical protein L3K06_01980 [Thermoplasmata archaeon]|nr:hypothetical protein [Thermoplasmata archaeon]